MPDKISWVDRNVCTGRQTCLFNDHETNVPVLFGDEEPWGAPFCWFVLGCDHLAVYQFFNDSFSLLSPMKGYLVSGADAERDFLSGCEMDLYCKASCVHRSLWKIICEDPRVVLDQRFFHIHIIVLGYEIDR